MQRLKTTRKVKSLEKLKKTIAATPKEYNKSLNTQNSFKININFNVEKLEQEIEVSDPNLIYQTIRLIGIKDL